MTHQFSLAQFVFQLSICFSGFCAVPGAVLRPKSGREHGGGDGDHDRELVVVCVDDPVRLDRAHEARERQHIRCDGVRNEPRGRETCQLVHSCNAIAFRPSRMETRSARSELDV